MKSEEFDQLKTIVEKQILIVLDFLMLDQQIKTSEIKQISIFVLEKIDKTTTTQELYSSFFDLLSTFPVLSKYLQYTFKNLTKYSHV